MLKKLTQQEAEENVFKKCEKRNYILVENFSYKNNKTKIHLKCNKDKYDWYVTYNNFLSKNQGCPKCSGNLRLTQQEAEQKVLEKCKEKNYELIKNFIYVNNDTIIHLKCNKDNYIWNIIYDSFIHSKSGCPKCGNRPLITQEEAEKKVLIKCKEKNYILVENFIYKNHKTKIHLKCNKDKHEWFVRYNKFINKNQGCPKCNGNLKITQQEAEERVLEKCKEKKYVLFDKFIYKGTKTKIHLKCTIDEYKWTPTYDSFIHNKSGCPKCGNVSKITQGEAEKNV